jgi:hypothetical protein
MGWTLALVLASTSALGSASAETRPHEGLCDGLLGAARLGIASGKVILVERRGDGRLQPISGKLGEAKVMPAFDLTVHSVALVARVVF